MDDMGLCTFLVSSPTHATEDLRGAFLHFGIDDGAYESAVPVRVAGKKETCFEDQ